MLPLQGRQRLQVGGAQTDLSRWLGQTFYQGVDVYRAHLQ